MVLGRGGRNHTMFSNRENTPASENRDLNSDSEGEDATETIKIQTRGLSSLPPPIPNESDRPLIRPDGKTQWIELPKVGKDRKPASVLTRLLRDHHPGVVNYKGKEVVAMKWEHYQEKKDSCGRSKADEVEAELWLRFRFEPDHEHAVRQHIASCAKQHLASIKYYARIQAILDHFRLVENRKVCDKIAGQHYLLKEEYIAQIPSWCTMETWTALVDEWCYPKFREKSEKNRANRDSLKYKPHKGGSNSIATICQKLSEKEGREVTKVEAWVHTHKGANLSDPNILNTEEATQCLERYKRKYIEKNGEGSDWLRSPVDSGALYDCNSGKPHGKWGLFNGAVDDKEVLAEVKSSRPSSVFKQQRREEAENERRRQAEKCRLQNIYTQNVIQWSTREHNKYACLQKLVETMARDQGYLSAEILPPPSPPPEPPTSPVSVSPNPSPDLGPDQEPGARIENGDNTFHVVTEGMFGGYLRSSASSADNVFPPLEDLGAF